MARITPSELQEIIQTTLNVVELGPFIQAANVLVTAKLGSSGLDDALLKEIERWVAAHFLAARVPQVKSESVGGASATYQVNTKDGLGSTVYGERALMLDVTGALARLGQKAASVECLEFNLEYEGS